MSYDFKAQIDGNIKVLSELATNSQETIKEFQKSTKEQSVQVGDYQLPFIEGNSIENLIKLDTTISDLGFGNFTSLLEGAKVPELPNDLDVITPQDMIDAFCLVKDENSIQPPISISPEDIQLVEFCKPEEPPAPQVSFEDFLKLCEAVTPPLKPSKELEETPLPNLDDAFKDINTELPEDNPLSLEDRTSQMGQVIDALSKLNTFGNPEDVLLEELSKTDIGNILLVASENLKSSGDIPSNLRSDINNSDINSLNDAPPRPTDTLAIDCVKILQPIIEESQKKGARLNEVKTRISQIKQEAKIGSIFLAFWESVNDTLNNPKFKLLNDLAKQKNEKQKEKDNTFVLNIIKRNRLSAEIDQINKKQTEIIKASFNPKVFVELMSLKDILNKNVKELTSEIDIKYDKYNTPDFIYDKTKSSTNSDKRIQKLQNDLVLDIGLIDIGGDGGVQKVIEKAKKTDEEFEKEINTSIEVVQKYGSAWGIEAITQGGDRLSFVKSYYNKVGMKLKDTYEPLSKELEDIQKEEIEIQKYFDELNTSIKDKLAEQGCELPELKDPETAAGNDVNYKGIPMDASQSPNIFDLRWWRKFCSLATIMNLVPIHWPVGLILPIIPKPLFIPCPIIWIPLVVINTPVALIVVLIGQCGVLPSPFVFILNTSDCPLGPIGPKSAWFPVAIRPMCKIKDDPTSKRLDASPEINIPMLNPSDLEKHIKDIQKIVSDNIQRMKNNIDEIERKKQNIESKKNEVLEKGKKVNDIQNKIASLTQSISNAVQKVSEFVNKIADNLSKINAAKSEIEAKKQEIESLKNQQPPDPNVNEKIQQAQNNITQKQSEVTSKLNENANLKNSISSYEKDIKDKEDELKKQSFNQQDLEASIKKRQADIEQEARDLAEKQKQNIILQQQNTGLLNKINVFSLPLGFTLCASLPPPSPTTPAKNELDPEITKLMPLYIDDLPTWERLSLLNIPLLLFLWKWCAAGKNGGGFLRDPI
jgi:hypothetical protein